MRPAGARPLANLSGERAAESVTGTKTVFAVSFSSAACLCLPITLARPSASPLAAAGSESALRSALAAGKSSAHTDSPDLGTVSFSPPAFSSRRQALGPSRSPTATQSVSGIVRRVPFYPA